MRRTFNFNSNPFNAIRRSFRKQPASPSPSMQKKDDRPSKSGFTDSLDTNKSHYKTDPKAKQETNKRSAQHSLRSENASSSNVNNRNLMSEEMGIMGNSSSQPAIPSARVDQLRQEAIGDAAKEHFPSSEIEAADIVLSKHHQQPVEIKQVPGRGGNFYFLAPQGDLYRYNPNVDEVLNTGLKGVNNITLGANGKLYATIEKTLVPLDQQGISSDEKIPLELDTNIQDICVNSLGNQVFALNTNGELFRQSLATKQNTRLRLPLQVLMDTPRSLTTDSRGDLWLLGTSNQVWHGKLEKTAEDKPSYVWKASGSPEQRPQTLETLADGRATCRTEDNQLLCFDQKSSTWDLVKHESLTEAAFDRLRATLYKPNAADCITFLGGVATARPGSKSVFTKPFSAVSNVAQSVGHLYRDIKHFDYSAKQNQSFERYSAQAQTFWNLLKSQHVPKEEFTGEVKHKIDEAVGKDITETALKLLNTITEVVEENPKLRKKMKPPKHDAIHEQSVLTQLYVYRGALYGSSDPVFKKLKEMRVDDLYLPFDMPQFHGIAARLVADQAILNDIHQNLRDAPESDISSLLKQATELQHKSLPHLLFRTGVTQTDPAGNAAKGFDGIQAIFRQQNDMLPSIVTKFAPFLEGTGKDISSMEDTAKLFSQLLHSMQPGDSLSFGKGTTNGFNTESFRGVMSGAWTAVSASPVVTWLVPIVDIGRLKDVELSITRTETGININISRARGKFTQLGVRTGLGVVELPDVMEKKVGQGWGFQGWEIAVKGKHSQNTRDTISLSIDDKGDGNVQKTITDIMTGHSDLFELLLQADETTASYSKNKALNLGIGNVGVLAGGTTMPGYGELTGSNNVGTGAASIDEIWDKIHSGNIHDAPADGITSALAGLGTVGKVLGAVVPEVAMDFGANSEHTTSVHSNGSITRTKDTQAFGLQGVRANLIGVGVLEADYANQQIPFDMKLGDDVGYPGFTGRTGIPSILPGAILGKSFNNLGPTNKSVSLMSSANGYPETITSKVTIKKTSTLVKNIQKHTGNIEQIPGMKQAVNTLLHQQRKKRFNFNLPVDMNMELKPQLLRDIPKERKAREKALTSLAKDLNNFRITGLSVSDTHQYNKTKALVVPAITREMRASLKATTTSAKVDLLYDRDIVISQAKKLLTSITHGDHAVNGTRIQKQLLVHMFEQLNSLLDSLAPNSKDYPPQVNSEIQQMRYQFNQQMKMLLIANEQPNALQKKAHSLLSAFVENTGNLLQRHGIPIFEGPAALASGDLFRATSTGKMLEDGGLKPYKNIPLTKSIEKIGELNKMQLKTVPAKKLKAAKAKADAIIDSVIQTLNQAADINVDQKHEVTSSLHAMSVHPFNKEQLAALYHKLDKLAPRD